MIVSSAMITSMYDELLNDIRNNKVQVLNHFFDPQELSYYIGQKKNYLTI